MSVLPTPDVAFEVVTLLRNFDSSPTSIQKHPENYLDVPRWTRNFMMQNGAVAVAFSVTKRTSTFHVGLKSNPQKLEDPKDTCPVPDFCLQVWTFYSLQFALMRQVQENGEFLEMTLNLSTNLGEACWRSWSHGKICNCKIYQWQKTPVGFKERVPKASFLGSTSVR